MIRVLILGLTMLPLLATGQVDKEVWLINGPKYLGEGFKTYKLDFVFDGRNSFVDGSSVPVGGFRIGIEHERVNRIGIGFYGFSNDVERVDFVTPEDSLVGRANLDFSYASLYFERVLFFNPKWEWSGTVHVGTGRVNILGQNAEEKFTLVEEVPVNPLEFSSSGYHHMSWWLSVGAGVGYRFMLNTPQEIRATYESVVYLAKVKIRIGKAIRAIGNKDVKNEY